ncbi:unnamed protein product [Rhizopus microsporus]
MTEPSITYQSFRVLFKVISHVFFREVKTSDSHLVPASGPCIFIVGPHANQFIDGVVFLSKNPRSSYALMAAVSYNKPLIGHVGKILNAIPVVRPQDIVTKGTGTIYYDPINNPFEIRGEKTRFKSELRLRDFVIFGRNHKVHVEEIISDTLLKITYSINLPQEEQGNGHAFKIAPHVDQTAVYDEVYHYLNNHECITIFPEGGSHDRSEMLPLKAGFAVMALGAAAANPSLDIKIVPVGMNYFHPDKFRSRAVVSFGHPISLDKRDIEDYKLGGEAKREAVTRLLDLSDEAFKAVTVNTPDYDTLMVIQAARRLYTTGDKRPSIDQVVKLNRHFASLWSKLRDDPNLKIIVKKVKYYNDMLNFFGIRDHQVEKLNIRPSKATFQLIKRINKLVIMAILGTPALVFNLPLIWITNYISKKKQRQALAGSSVKIQGKDVIASWKVIVVSIAAPTLYGIYALFYLLFLIKRRSQLSLQSKLRRAACVWAIQPILSYLLMRLGDTGLDIYKSIKPLFLAIRNPEAGEIIRQIRKDLAKDITDFINQHAPELGLEGTSTDEENSREVHEDLSASMATTTTTGDDMPESALISNSEAASMIMNTDGSSIQSELLTLDSSSSSSQSNFEIESIVLEDNEA